MRLVQRSAVDQIMLGLLAALVVTNLTLPILLRTTGPLMGLVFYLILLAPSLRTRERHRHLLMVGGMPGVAVHVVEVAMTSWSACSELMALNLIVPAAPALSAWTADRSPG